MSRRRVVITLEAVTLAAALGACHGSGSREGPRPTPDSARRVHLAAVVRSEAEGQEYVPATVAARERATLGSRVPATVVELPFREGERVTKGAVVARLDDTALRSAESAAEVASKAADTDLARVETLVARNASTPRERDEALARAAAARAALLGARDNLAYAVLRAPFDGVVAARPVHVGDVVSPGAALLEIEGDGGLEVRATVSTAVAASLEKGQSLSCEIDGQRTAVAAIVFSIAPAADPATHRVELRAELAPRPGLQSGLFARVVIPRADAPARLQVPSAAIVERGGLSGVFVVADGSARLRWVAVGESRGGSTELRAGADAGERVVLDPAGLVDGARVEAEP